MYVGESSLYLRKRINNHKYNVGDTDECSALSRHAIQEHLFDLVNTIILTTDSNKCKRHIKEMVEIKKDLHYLNFKSDLLN